MSVYKIPGEVARKSLVAFAKKQRSGCEELEGRQIQQESGQVGNTAARQLLRLTSSFRPSVVGETLM